MPSGRDVTGKPLVRRQFLRRKIHHNRILAQVGADQFEGLFHLVERDAQQDHIRAFDGGRQVEFDDIQGAQVFGPVLGLQHAVIVHPPDAFRVLCERQTGGGADLPKADDGYLDCHRNS